MNTTLPTDGEGVTLNDYLYAENEVARLLAKIEQYQNLCEAYHNLTDHCDEVTDSDWHEEKAALHARGLDLLKAISH